jgi:iron complex transport system substrate-binding protein
LAGATEQARVLADGLAAEVARQRAARGAAEAAPVPSVFIEIWGDPLMTAGRRSFVAELVTLAGGRNLGDEVEGDYVTVSPEWVVRSDPDIILCLYMASDTRAAARVAARAGWQYLRAVRAGRVHDGFATDVLFRPGPRVLEGVESLRRVIEAVAP